MVSSLSYEQETGLFWEPLRMFWWKRNLLPLQGVKHQIIQTVA